MVATPATGDSSEALEAGPGGLPGTASPRVEPGASGQHRQQYAALVAKLPPRDQSRLSDQLFRPARTPPAGRVTSTPRTARCGPARRVVWQGSRRFISPCPYADSNPA